MGFKMKSVTSFADETSVGLDRAPVGAIVQVDSYNLENTLFTLRNKDGVTNTTTIAEGVTANNLKLVVEEVVIPEASGNAVPRSSMVKGSLTSPDTITDTLQSNTIYTGTSTSQDIVTGVESYDINYDSTRTYTSGSGNNTEYAFDKDSMKLFHYTNVSSLTGLTGPEEITNGTFDTDVTSWVPSGGITFKHENGTAKISNSGSAYASQELTVVVGKIYSISIDLDQGVGGFIDAGVGTTAEGLDVILFDERKTSGMQNYTSTFVATSTSMYVTVYGSSGGYGWFDNVSVKETFPATHWTIVPDDTEIDYRSSKAIVQCRNVALGSRLHDTLRGVGAELQPYQTAAEITSAQAITSFNIDGITVGTDGNTNNDTSNFVVWHQGYDKIQIHTTNEGKRAICAYDSDSKASMTLYQGSGTAGHEIPHNLGVAPDMWTMKSLTAVEGWNVGTSDMTLNQDYLYLNTIGGISTNGAGLMTSAIDTSNITVGTHASLNGLNVLHMAYSDANSSVIQVGTYSGTNTTNPITGLGFKPGKVILKSTTGTQNWIIYDDVRGGASYDAELFANLPDIENTNANAIAAIESFDADGFTVGGTHAAINGSGNDYMYIAYSEDYSKQRITTEKSIVYKGTTYTGNGTSQDIVNGIKMNLDGELVDKVGGQVWTKNRGLGRRHALTSTLFPTNMLVTDTTAALAVSGYSKFNTNGFGVNNVANENNIGETYASWNNKTNKYTNGYTNHGKPYEIEINPTSGFFQGVYEGSATTGHEIPHGMGIAPDFLVVKNLGTGNGWATYNSTSGATKNMYLSTTAGDAVAAWPWNNTEPTTSVFTVGDATNDATVNASGNKYYFYGYVSVATKTKVGTFTGTGVSNPITGLGFQPAYIMIKRTDSASDWGIYDSKRDNDGYPLYANLFNAEATGTDLLNIDADGFTLITSSNDNNTDGGTYMYIAIADHADHETTLYTGNGATQNVVTDLNMDVLLGDTIIADGALNPSILDVFSGGTAFSSGGTAVNAFDDSFGTNCYLASTTLTVGYILASNKALNKFRFGSFTTSYAISGTVEASLDTTNGVDGIWVELLSWAGLPALGVAGYHDYLTCSNNIAYKAYRFNGVSETTDLYFHDVDGIEAQGEVQYAQIPGGMTWIKGRSIAYSNQIGDTIRRHNKILQSDTTSTESTVDISYNTDGFSIGANTAINENASTFISWNWGCTHRYSGVTNHNMPYTCAFNPESGFGMVKYTGSGTAGHIIPHHLGAAPDFVMCKNLIQTTNWATYTSYAGGTKYNILNQSIADQVGSTVWNDTNPDSEGITVGTAGEVNSVTTNEYVMYFWANTAPQATQELIEYSGTGLASNKITTSGKPAYVMVKRTDVADQWVILDADRLNGVNHNHLFADASSVENTDVNYDITIYDDGFEASGSSGTNWTSVNASGGTYVALVMYDTDLDNTGSKITTTVNDTILKLTDGELMFSAGYSSQVSADNTYETFTGTKTLQVTLEEGINYIKRIKDSVWQATLIEPVFNKTSNTADYYINGVWYDLNGTEYVTPITYLPYEVTANAVLSPTLVTRITFPDIVQGIVNAQEFQGTNACTAWVSFDGTTTPPTVKDSFNVSDVSKSGAGTFVVYYEDEMLNSNYAVVASDTYTSYGNTEVSSKSTTTTGIITRNTSGTASDTGAADINVVIFGGK